MSQAVLTTDRLRLVPLGPEHLADEVELDSDPEVMRYLTGRASTTAEVEAAHRRRLAAAEAVPGLGYWAGYVDDEFVGWWILEPAVANPSASARADAALGYRLLRRWWRQGLASEGCRALLRHGFEDLGLEHVVAQTMAVNLASRATMSSVGLRYVRTFHEAWADPLPGFEEGEVEYAVTRDAWLAAHAD